MRHLSHLLLLLYIVLIAPAPWAQANSTPDVIDFKHLSLEDGLANPTIYDITQDHQGFIWFATGNGVSRFNGYEFTNYLPNDKAPHAIGRGPVLSLFVDSKKRLWATVMGSGLYRYDESNDHFSALKNIPGDPSSLSSDMVYFIAEDKDGDIWISTIDGGLNRYNEVSGRMRRYAHSPELKTGIGSDKIAGLLVDQENHLWISTLDSGFYRYDINNDSFSSHLPDMPHAIGMVEDRHGDIWIPTLGKGLVRYLRNQERFITYRHHADDPNSISHDQVIRVVEDAQGTIWLTTWGGGVNIYDRKRDRFIRHQRNASRPASLNDDNTWGIFADKHDVIWVGTYGAGINKYDRKSERFQQIRHAPGDPNGLPGNGVKAILEDSRKELWFGTLGAGLCRYNPQTKTVSNFRHDPEDPTSISNDNVWMIAEDSSGDLWLATENGLNRYDRDADRFVRHMHAPGNPNSPCGNIIRSVMVDRDDNVWIGEQHAGIDRFDPKAGQFFHFTVEGAHNTLLYQDKGGRIWGGNAQTINLYNEENGIFTPLLIKSDSDKRLHKGFFTAIKEDNRGRMWLGLIGGLVVIEPDGTFIERYGAEQGLNDEAVADIQFAPGGSLWVSTARGLSMLDSKTGRFRNYEIGAFNRGASLVDSKGRLFFGGLNGVTHFLSEDIIDNAHIPPVVVTGLKTDRRSYHLGQLLSNGDPIELTHEDRRVSFEFAALDYSDPAKNLYKCKLEGFDTNWVQVNSKRRMANYTNLDAGNYTFKVTGSNNDAVWNPQGISISFRVLPPWWESWWFYTLIALSAITILGFIYNTKTRQLAKERLVSQKLRESEERFRLIFENSPLGIIHFDRHGTLSACNDAFGAIFDRPRGNLIGTKLADLPLSDQVLAVTPQILSGKATFNERADITQPGDRIIPTRTMFEPIASTNGKITGGIGLFEDISVETNAEKEKADLEAKLQHAMKLEAIGTLAGGIAHDFNNILGIIIGYADLAMAREDNPPQHREQISQIKTAGMRARELVQQILAFSRQDDTDRILLQPALIVKESLKMLRPTLPATIAIHTDIAGDIPLILTNPTHIHQILINLCTNGLHAMQETGGELKIALHRVDLSKADLSQEPDVQPGSFVRLTVSDSGPGIPEEITDRVFEPYFTTKETGKGTGMGLSIVHGIVKSTGGFITIHPGPVTGTECQVYIPAQTGKARPANTVEDDIPKGSERILFVDDEKMLVNVGNKILEQLGYTVRSTTCSVSALEIFQQDPHGFDLVITDQTMPDMTGANLSRRILEIRPEIPIIMCTGFSAIISEAKARLIGIRALALKPLAREDIAILIRKVLATKAATGNSAMARLTAKDPNSNRVN